MSSKHGMAKLLAISTVLLLYQRLSLATLACKRGQAKVALTNTAACAGGDYQYVIVILMLKFKYCYISISGFWEFFNVPQRTTTTHEGDDCNCNPNIPNPRPEPLPGGRNLLWENVNVNWEDEASYWNLI